MSYIIWGKSKWRSDIVSTRSRVWDEYIYCIQLLLYIYQTICSNIYVKNTEIMLGFISQHFLHISNANHWLVNYIMRCHSGKW